MVTLQESITKFYIYMIWDVWNEFILILRNTNLLLYKYYEKNVQFYSARDVLTLLMIIGMIFVKYCWLKSTFSSQVLQFVEIIDHQNKDDGCHGC